MSLLDQIEEKVKMLISIHQRLSGRNTGSAEETAGDFREKTNFIQEKAKSVAPGNSSETSADQKQKLKDFLSKFSPTIKVDSANLKP